MDETKELLLAIKHAVEIIDAKVTAMQEEQNYIQGDVKAIQEEQGLIKADVRSNVESVQLLHEKLDNLQKHGNKLGRHLNAVEGDLDDVILRVEALEGRTSVEF